MSLSLELTLYKPPNKVFTNNAHFRLLRIKLLGYPDFKGQHVSCRTCTLLKTQFRLHVTLIIIL